MVKRHAHLSNDHLVECVDCMLGGLEVVNESEEVTNQLRATN